MAECVKCHSHNIIESEKGFYCCNCGWDSEKEEYAKRMTNADRIRSMSDEELVEFISKVNRTCIVDALGGDTRCDDENINCTECNAQFCGIQKWLQSEVEE